MMMLFVSLCLCTFLLKESTCLPVMKLKLFTSKKWQFSNENKANFQIPKDFKIISGGAIAEDTYSYDDRLVSSFPNPNQRNWSVKAINKFNYLILDVHAVGIYDPKNEWEVVYKRKQSKHMANPTVSVALPPRYTLVGGGVVDDTRGDIHRLTSCYADKRNSWVVAAKTYNHTVRPQAINALAIGVRHRATGYKPPCSIVKDSPPLDKYNRVTPVTPRAGKVIIAGGAQLKNKDTLRALSGLMLKANGKYSVDYEWFMDPRFYELYAYTIQCDSNSVNIEI